MRLDAEHMYCTRCGKLIKKEYLFCNYCGEPARLQKSSVRTEKKVSDADIDLNTEEELPASSDSFEELGEGSF